MKIHKPKPWINQACKEIHTATLGMNLTSVVCKLETKINLSKSKVKFHPYSKSISTTKCVIASLFKINMHHQMWNRAPTPNRYAPTARTWNRGLQHVNWVWRPLHHQSLTQACKEIHTATLGMELTSVVCKLEIKINLSKSKVKLHLYSKSISTTKCVISPLFKINMHHQMWNRPPTPNWSALPARTWTRGLQHVNWVWRPL